MIEQHNEKYEQGLKTYKMGGLKISCTTTVLIDAIFYFNNLN